MCYAFGMNSPVQADFEPKLVTLARRGASGDPIAAATIDLSPARVLLRRIVDTYHPEEVWLFGSRARGEAHAESDWDLMELLADDRPGADLDPVRAWELQLGSGAYADMVLCHVTDFRNARDWVNTLAYDVARDGVRVYAR